MLRRQEEVEGLHPRSRLIEEASARIQQQREGVEAEWRWIDAERRRLTAEADWLARLAGQPAWQPSLPPAQEQRPRNQQPESEPSEHGD